jgi:hypothetical protein
MANSRRKCANCKQFFKLADMARIYGTNAWCSENCAAEWAIKTARKLREGVAKTEKKAKAKKKKRKSIARLVEEAAVLLQKLVRLEAADSNGYVRSFTSGEDFPWQEMQGSHFIQRNRLATKLHEMNVHPQTKGENGYEMKTATGVLKYRRALVSAYGEVAVRELEKIAETTKKYTRQEVEEITADFKARIKAQEKRLGL